jgi:hypothetical protein
VAGLKSGKLLRTIAGISALHTELHLSFMGRCSKNRSCKIMATQTTRGVEGHKAFATRAGNMLTSACPYAKFTPGWFVRLR